MNDYDEQTTREYLIEVINEGIKELNYEGLWPGQSPGDTEKSFDSGALPHDYNAIYWFLKGTKLPKPQSPKRYDQTDEYINRMNKRLDNELFNTLIQTH